MDLQRSTWPEVEDYLQRRSDIVVPVGSTEQHGPAGLIGTDALCPAFIARAVGDRDGVLVAPAVAYGNAHHHLGFAGTVSLRPTTLVALLTDLVESCTRQGFEHVFFLNGHGGNIAPVQTAIAEVQAGVTLDGATPVRCALSNWWEGPRVSALLAQLFGDADGEHATCGEISLTWYEDPSARRDVEGLGKAPSFSGIHDADDYRRRYPDGRIGSDPAHYSSEAGAEIHAAAIDDTVEALRALREAD
jgi:creatinine amidohydrolase